jgi:hypothetical protein
MTNQEWKRRYAERILKAVRKAGKIKIRDLKRATHYSRGPGDAADLWDETLNFLEDEKLVMVQRRRLFVIEGEDDLGWTPQFVMTPR